MQSGQRQIEQLQEAACLDLWNDTYRTGGNDVAAAIAAERLAAQSAGPSDTSDANSMFALKMLWGAKWLDAGRTQLVVGHKYAAALMASSVVESIAEDMIVPWQAFSIDLPEGLLVTERLSFHRVTVGIYEGLPFGCVMTLFGSRQPMTESQGYVQFNRIANNPADLFFAKESALLNTDGTVRDFDAKERAMRMAIRLTTGLLYTMQHTDNFRAREYPSKKQGDGRSGPPPHRVYVVGKPMSLDCRPAVQHYMSGDGHAPPAVQGIVRGHYKRQVMGVARSGRKVIWVEPYWRGPEDAPILVRPYAVGPND